MKQALDLVKQMHKTPTTIYPIILCGGSDTRLWPLSRTAYPKQLLPLAGEHTMLQATVQRAAALGTSAGLQVAAPVVVTNEEHRFLVRQQLQDTGHIPAWKTPASCHCI